MAKKKPVTIQPPERERKRYFTDSQCRAAAARIKAQMPQYQEARTAWGKLDPKTGGFPYSFVPLYPADPEQIRERITRLYHPAEAAVILAELMETGVIPAN